jgi:hypothetical protein
LTSLSKLANALPPEPSITLAADPESDNVAALVTILRSWHWAFASSHWHVTVKRRTVFRGHPCGEPYVKKT